VNWFREDPDRGRSRDNRRTPRRIPPGRSESRRRHPARPFRTLAFWVLVALLVIVAYNMYPGNFMATQRAEVSYTRFIQEVERGNIQTLQVLDNTVTGELASRRRSDRRVPAATSVQGIQDEHPRRWRRSARSRVEDEPGIEIEVQKRGFNWLSFLFSSLPFLLLLPLWMI
jgi:cell division protease FtsH